jgi:hydrogenase expression/formation protein HypC
MCLGVPGLVVERRDSALELAHAVVEFSGVRRKVCIACVPDSQPGDYVIVHAGIAISRIDPAEAERVFALLRESGDGDGWDQGSNGAQEIDREIP